MADYTLLKAAIQQVIKTNGNQEITGLLLQQTLLSLIDDLNLTKQDKINFVTNAVTRFLREDGTFKEIPTPTGSFTNNVYLSETPSDVGAYKVLNYVPDSSETVKANTISAADGNKLVGTYLYPVGLSTNLVPAGPWSFIFNTFISSAVANTNIGVQCFVRNLAGVETNLFTVWSDDINSSSMAEIKINFSGQVYTVNDTDRMGVRIFLRTTSVPTATVSFIVGSNYSSYFNTPVAIRHKQIRALNEDSNYQHITSTEKTNFQAAYTDRFKWDGGSSGLNASNARESLGLRIGIDVLAYNGTAADSNKLGGYAASEYQRTIAAGTTLDYYRGDKTWQVLNTSVVPELTNLYFTSARSRATVIDTLTLTNTAILSTDSFQTAFGKAQAQINNRAMLNGSLVQDFSVKSLNLDTTILYKADADFLKTLQSLFYYDSANDSIRALKNFYSVSGVSAFGIGSGGGGGGGVVVIDNLTSTLTNAALSANQGRILKGFVDLKQPQLNGTGLVRMSGTGVTYDNNSYALASHTHNQIYSISNAPTSALLVNNRSDDEAGSAWIYWDALGGATNPWGVKHNQPDNYIEFFGNGVKRAYVDLNSGSGKVLVGSDIGNTVASQSHNHNGTYALLAGSISQAFSVSSLTASNVVVAGGNKGFQNDIYYANVANPIWTFGNAPTYGISYYQGSALSGIGDAIGFHFGTVGTPPFYVTGYGDIKCRDIAMNGALGVATTGSFSGNVSAASFTSGGNAVLHAGNYSSYALPLSGGTITSGLGGLEIKRGGSTTSGIKYSNANGVLGYIGFLNTSTPVYIASDGVTTYPIMHSGNIGSQSVNYAASAGNSSTTSQRTFEALLLGARTGYGNSSAPYYDNLIYSNVYPLYELQMGNSGQSDYATYLRFRVNARGIPDTLINALTLAPDYALINGSLGVRNINPQASLHIGSGTGSLHYNGGTDGTMLIHGVGGNRSQLELLSPDSSMRMIIQTVQGYAHNMSFTNGHLFLDLTSGYNMSVGFGADQGYKLAVNGGVYVASGLKLNSLLTVVPNTGSYSEGIRIGAYGGWSNVQFKVDTTVNSGTKSGQWLIGVNPADTWCIVKGGSESPSAIPTNGLSIPYDLSNIRFNSNVMYHAGNANRTDTPWTASTITASTELKIGAGWSAVQNGTSLDLRYGGVMKARLDSSGNITATGGVTAFAV